MFGRRSSATIPCYAMAERTVLTEQAAALGANLINTKYGRDDESESDFYGMKYMAAAGYDTQAAVTLQQKT